MVAINEKWFSIGGVLEAYDTDAYGNTLIFTGPGPDNTWFTDDDSQSSGGVNDIIYCGYRYDAETQNYYVRNRYYLPTLGRWLTRDPIGYQGGINLYEYVQSSPVGNVDAEGLGCCAGLERAYANAEREVRLAKKTLLGDYRSGLHYLLAEQRDQAQANALKGAVSEDYLLYQIQTLIVMFQSVGESRDQNTGDVAGLSVSIREQDMDYRRYRRALARANAAVNEKIMDEQQETFYRSAEKSDRAALTNAERAAWKARNAYHRCLRIQGQAAELLRSAGP